MRRRSNVGPFQRLLEAGSRTTYHGKIRTRGGKRKATVRAGKQSVYKGVRIIPVGNGEFETSLDSSRFESTRDARRFVDSWKKGQGNPSRRYIARKDAGGEYLIIDLATDDVIRTAKTKAAAIQIVGYLNARAMPGWELKRNPRGKSGDFSRCVKAVSQRKGAKDPNAICAASERKRGLINPESERYMLVKPRGAAPSYFYTQNEVYRYLDEKNAKGSYKIYRLGPGRKELVDTVKRNPAASAQAVSEEFHGRPVREMVPVQQKRHYHKYLAELGELRKLVVESRDGKHRVTLTGFKKAMLCTNEDKNQLFIVGGDQSVNLKDFGIKDPHETETLGEVTKIEYFTDKEHLGDEGGTAVYVHKFRSTNDNGKHKSVRMARNPDLIYYLRDEHLEFSGGSYFIRAEGIDL